MHKSLKLMGLVAASAMALMQALAQQSTPLTPASASDPSAAAKPSGRILGSIKSGGVPLPGVSVSAANTLTGKKVFTATAVDGSYSISIASRGRWVVRAELAAFAAITKEIVFSAETLGTTQQADFEMILLSRQQKIPDQQAQTPEQQIANAVAGSGFQNLSLSQSEASAGNDNAGGAGQQSNGESLASSMPVAAMGGNAAADSVSVTGNMGHTENFSFDEGELRQRIEDARAQGGAFQIGGNPGQFGGGGLGGGFGGGGFGGGPGGGGITIAGAGGAGGRFRGIDINKPHGQVYYNFGNSALDARPYSLNSVAAEKPSYSQSRYGVTVGGPLNIPHIYEGGTKTMYFLNYVGQTVANPFDVFATVPTLLERSGDFSQTLIRSGVNAGSFVTIYDPITHTPILGNKLTAINSAAQGLLSYFPLPNQPGSTQNYHAVDSSNTNSQNVNFRLNHTFGERVRRQPGARGAGGGGGGRGGRGGGNQKSINLAFNYRTSSSDIRNYSPFLGGASSANGYNFNVGYVQPFHGLTTRTGFVVNKNHIESAGQYANVTDVESGLGIAGISTNPFDYGVPTLSFTNYSALRDVTPLLRDDLTWQITESVSWNHKKHNVRFGGDFHRSAEELRSNSNPRGSFTFTGISTALAATTGTGYDFADFLLGRAQQTTVQFSPNTYHYNNNSYNLFIQDDWRARGKLTINFGLRYEYVSPWNESGSRIVNLDAAPGFTAVAAVQPGQVGPFTGAFPVSLVNPDRNNFAPRVGIAWSPRKKTVIRAGYGVNYNLGQYGSIMQQLANQPPFAFTETNTATAAAPLTLQNGFPVAPAGLTNNFGIDKNYRLGYSQTWNVNVQQEVMTGLVVNVDYTGTKGASLDLERAPNRGPAGLQLNNVQAFIWESSGADSILHSGTLRVRKRMQHGVSFGGSYTYAKSIDDASSIGGGAVVVAQNDQNLAAERGLSSFDQRHRFTADYNYELPWGTNKLWLNEQNWAGKTFGDWSFNGSVTIASGTPFTARVVGDFADVARGTNGTLRANYNGQPIYVSDPTLQRWFNSAAFTVPAAGTFGNSARNLIIGPGTFSFNTSLSKTFPIKDAKAFEFRASATNLFNHANYASIDTVVNSPTFGRVVSVGSMRKMQIQTRFRF